MGDLIKEFVEAVFHALMEYVLEKAARAVYGTKDLPGRVFWRGMLRTVVLMGALAAVLGLSGIAPFDHLPGWLFLVWLPAWLCMLLGEQNFGHKKLLWTACAAGLAVFVTGVLAII